MVRYIRAFFFLYAFNYRYLANSLVTYSPLSNYDDEMKDQIINTSPFRVESQIVPNDEKGNISVFSLIIVSP